MPPTFLITVSLLRLVESSKIIFSYSLSVFKTNSLRPIALRRLLATLAAKLSPCLVMTGRPAQSASVAVVCALKLKYLRTNQLTYILRDEHP